MSDLEEQPNLPSPLLTQEVADRDTAAFMPAPFLRRLLFNALRIVGYAVGVVFLLVITFILLGIPPGKALAGVWIGAVGNDADGHWYAISETLVKMSPLLLTGLGVVIAWRAGMFSIGGEGQLLIGALAAVAVGKFGVFLPPALLTIVMLLAGIASGAFWGGIAGWLRTKRNVQEVISTIMLNYIALYLVGTLVGSSGPLQEHTHISEQTDPLPNAVLFARLVPASLAGGIQTRLHSGVLLGLLAVPIIYLLMQRTQTGFALRVLGQNPEAARVARFAVDGLRLRAMLISGGLCGLAGAIELLGVSARLDANFSSGWGYTAIPIALLGGLEPIGTLFSALFFGGLTAGCGYLSRFYGVSSVLIYVVQAAAVLAVVGARAWQSRHTGGETDT